MYFEGDLVQQQVSQNGCELCPCRSSKAERIRSWATCSTWAFLSRGGWPETKGPFQPKSFLYSAILWFKKIFLTKQHLNIFFYLIFSWEHLRTAFSSESYTFIFLLTFVINDSFLKSFSQLPIILGQLFFCVFVCLFLWILFVCLFVFLSLPVHPWSSFTKSQIRSPFLKTENLYVHNFPWFAFALIWLLPARTSCIIILITFICFGHPSCKQSCIPCSLHLIHGLFYYFFYSENSEIMIHIFWCLYIWLSPWEVQY